MPDATAVAMVLAGDLEAFAELVERYDRSIGACLLSIVRNREATKDLKAQCWAAIYAKLGKFDPKRNFRSWAVGFARNLGYSYLRSRKRVPKMVSFDAMPEEEQPTLPGPESDHEQIVAVEEALRIVEPLPRNQQVAVLGYVCDEMSYKELADLTGRKPGTLQSDVRRGLGTLRRRMG